MNTRWVLLGGRNPLLGLPGAPALVRPLESLTESLMDYSAHKQNLCDQAVDKFHGCAREINRRQYSLRKARLAAAECQTCGGDDYGFDEGDTCYQCGAPAQATDHILALKPSGTHCNHAFAPICKSCNSSKGARVPVGFPWSLLMCPPGR